MLNGNAHLIEKLVSSPQVHVVELFNNISGHDARRGSRAQRTNEGDSDQGGSRSSIAFIRVLIKDNAQPTHFPRAIARAILESALHVAVLETASIAEFDGEGLTLIFGEARAHPADYGTRNGEIQPNYCIGEFGPYTLVLVRRKALK